MSKLFRGADGILTLADCIALSKQLLVLRGGQVLIKLITLEKMAVLLKKMDNYRIIYHIRPDGDCIGSA